RVHAQGGGNLADVADPHVNLSVLDLANEVLMLAGIDRQGGLRQPRGLPQPAHVLRQHPPDVHPPRHREWWTTSAPCLPISNSIFSADCCTHSLVVLNPNGCWRGPLALEDCYRHGRG